MKGLLFSFLIAVMFTSCTTVKPYQRQFLSDAEMQMQIDAGKNFNNYVHTIREGATPTGATKASGGCGCN